MHRVRTSLLSLITQHSFRSWAITVLSSATGAILVRFVLYVQAFVLRLINIQKYSEYKKKKNNGQCRDRLMDDVYRSMPSPLIRSQRVVFVSIYCYANITIRSILGARYFFFVFLIYRDTLLLFYHLQIFITYVAVPMSRVGRKSSLKKPYRTR